MNITQWLCCLVSSVAIATPGWAEAVWHCSRNNPSTEQTAAIPAENDEFSLASLNSSNEVIGISVRDLFDIYTGIPVSVSGVQLSACFLLDHDDLSSDALSTLGITRQGIQALSRQSSIVQSNLFYVREESDMLTCMARHFPAVGYLAKPTVSESALPCF